MKKEFILTSDLSVIKKVSQQVLDALEPAGFDSEARYDVRLCLEEALVNAIQHGNKLDANKVARLAVELDAEKVTLIVEDEGAGFDPKRVSDCTKKENLLKTGGRGVFIIQKYMDKVLYNDKGNRVTMMKYIKKRLLN